MIQCGMDTNLLKEQEGSGQKKGRKEGERGQAEHARRR